MSEGSLYKPACPAVDHWVPFTIAPEELTEKSRGMRRREMAVEKRARPLSPLDARERRHIAFLVLVVRVLLDAVKPPASTAFFLTCGRRWLPKQGGGYVKFLRIPCVHCCRCFSFTFIWVLNLAVSSFLYLRRRTTRCKLLL